MWLLLSAETAAGEGGRRGGGGLTRSRQDLVLRTVALQDSRPGAIQPKSRQKRVRRRGGKGRGREEEVKILENQMKGGGRAERRRKGPTSNTPTYLLSHSLELFVLHCSGFRRAAPTLHFVFF